VKTCRADLYVRIIADKSAGVNSALVDPKLAMHEPECLIGCAAYR